MKSKSITDLPGQPDSTSGAETEAFSLLPAPSSPPPSDPAPTADKPQLYGALSPTEEYTESVQSVSSSAAGTTVAVTNGGMTFDLTFDVGAPASFMTGIEQAASMLSATIADKITVNLNIHYTGTGGGAFAGPSTGLYENYATIRSDLINQASPGDTTFNALVNSSSIAGQSLVAVWNSQLKALGLMSPTNAGTDGSATFATDINPSLLIGVALHELTHALGRVPYGSAPDIFDLYRFTSPGVQLFTGGNTAVASYFSVDGGNTDLADYGLHSDPSDFLNSGPTFLGGPYSTLTPGDPFNELYGSGTLQSLTAVDKKLLDALGFHTFAPVDLGPVATASNFTASHNQDIAASLLFSVTDADHDPITAYQFFDSTADPASGHWVVNGVAQGANVAIDVTSIQLSSASFQSGSGSDDLWVRASDGFTWGAWTEFHVNAPVDHAPVAAATDFAASHNQNIAASSLFSVTDADHDPITAYQFWDSTTDPASGHWLVNGVAQGKNVAIDVTAAQLSGTTFQSGFVSDDLWVRASDGILWGNWTEFHVNTAADHAPVANASDLTASHNQNIAASSLFSATDADHDPIIAYQFWDSTADPASGHWIVNGVAQGQNVAIDVSAAQLSSTTFHSGFVSDDLWVRASDGVLWGNWTEFHVNTPADHAPVAAATDFAASHNQNIAASSLFSVTDADSDPITDYQFWDSTADPASGHWVVNGVAQGANVAIDVSAGQLSSTTFQSDFVSDDLWVRASDGFVWGAWQEFHVNTPVEHAPVATASDFIASHNQNIAASSLFSVTDADHDPITAYEFWDTTADSANGHWVVNGVAQGANVAIDVTATQLSSTSFQSGSGSDDLWVRASDGFTWGAWTEFHVSAPVDHAPVAAATDFAVSPNQDVAASSLFSVTDVDHDSIAAYQFWDSTTDPASGHWLVSGVAQGKNVAIDVTAAQLSSTTFQSGSVSDDLWVRASDGITWGSWTEFHVLV